MKRILREPLLQFLVIGAVVFALYSLVQRETATTAPERIVVSPGRVAQLRETFVRTWQRQPTEAELRGLVDGYVREEIFYREGRKLGLDADDVVFRRRMQQKMEFLAEPSEAELTPGEGELQAYLESNRDRFRFPAEVAFRQIFFDTDRGDARAGGDARSTLTALRQPAPLLDPQTLGDRTLLPRGMPRTPIDRIAISFGREFADALQAAPVGEWSGPVRSTFGLHLIRIDDKAPPRDPDLSEIVESVTREWESDRRRTIAEDRYSELRRKYEVVVEEGWAGASPSGGDRAAAQ